MAGDSLESGSILKGGRDVVRRQIQISRLPRGSEGTQDDHRMERDEWQRLLFAVFECVEASGRRTRRWDDRIAMPRSWQVSEATGGRAACCRRIVGRRECQKDEHPFCDVRDRRWYQLLPAGVLFDTTLQGLYNQGIT